MKVWRSQIEIIRMPVIGEDSVVCMFGSVRKDIAILSSMRFEASICALLGIANLRHLQIEAASVCGKDRNRARIQQLESILPILMSREAAISKAAEGFIHETRKVFNCCFSGFSGHSTLQSCC